MSNGGAAYQTADSTYPDLNGSMQLNATNDDVATYTSNTLGDAAVNNRPAPPAISCVLTFSGGQQYTICGHHNGVNFKGKAQQGEQSCPADSKLGNGDDDWTATSEQPEEKPKPKAGKKLASKKAAQKPASKKK